MHLTNYSAPSGWQRQATRRWTRGSPGALLPTGPAADPAALLSDRETQALRLASQGLANVFRRVGVADRTSAAMWARDNPPDV